MSNLSYTNDMDDKTFCAIPFVSMMINTDGSMRLCCMASRLESTLRKNGTSKRKVIKDKITDVWNDDDLRNIRMLMLNGIPVKACEPCYSQERLGLNSARKQLTDEWVSRIGRDALDSLVSMAMASDGRISLPPIYLDLRFGNLCNLMCRMCSLYSSSQIAKEHMGLISDDRYRDIWTSQYGDNAVNLSELEGWYESDLLWDEIIGMIPTMRKVYMTGGEPTLVQGNYRFMQACIDSGHAKNIELLFNTNCTNVTDAFMSQISSFKSVYISASIDGYDHVNEYIRYPSNWRKVSDNLERLVKAPNVQVSVTCVAQVYNVLDHSKLLVYLENLSHRNKRLVSIDFTVNRHPAYFDMLILPAAIRKRAVGELESYKKDHGFYSDAADRLITLLSAPDHPNGKELLGQFVAMTSILDKRRGQEFGLVFPALSAAISAEISG